VSASARDLRAFGTDCRVSVVDRDERRAAERLADAVAELERLEQAWSRFRPDSELSAINRAAGRPVVVSDLTFEVVAMAARARRLTGGRFDATILDALEAAGYDRSFEQIGPVVQPSTGRVATVGRGRLVLDPDRRAVTVAPGHRLDLGGIGKGHAADLVAGHLVLGGALGACVDLGGDVRVVGTAPEGPSWPVAVRHPVAGRGDLGIIDVAEGGIATSSRLRRRWVDTAGSEGHHLIDPSTGRPSTSDLVAVTVVAGEAAWAEVFAKAALLAGSVDGIEMLAEADLAALVVTEAGDVLTAGPMDLFLRSDVTA
jgi:thiamine biosynthesis lipoprotein